MIRNIVIITVIMTISVLLVFWLNYKIDIDKARTAVLTLIILLEFMRVYIIRFNYGLSIFSNKWLLVSVFSSLVFLMVIIYTPLSYFFHTSPIDLFTNLQVFVIFLISSFLSRLALWLR